MNYNIEFILEMINKHKSLDSSIILEYQMFDAEENDPFILVIITPLMKRVHEKVLPFSSMYCNLKAIAFVLNNFIYYLLLFTGYYFLFHGGLV